MPENNCSAHVSPVCLHPDKNAFLKITKDLSFDEFELCRIKECLIETRSAAEFWCRARIPRCNHHLVCLRVHFLGKFFAGGSIYETRFKGLTAAEPGKPPFSIALLSPRFAILKKKKRKKKRKGKYFPLQRACVGQRVFWRSGCRKHIFPDNCIELS